MTPVERPLPRFIAAASSEALPYGRWAEQLGTEFLRGCGGIDDRPADLGRPTDALWFPERSWGGRTFVPVTAREELGEGVQREPLEFFGHVSFERLESGHPHGFLSSADFTDITAESNPDWEIDLNDDEIGTWSWDDGRRAHMTLVWGRPLVPGAVVATAELAGEIVDQAPLVEDRFTLVAVDALQGDGDEHFLTVRLWNARGEQVAEDTLYAEEGEE